MPKLTPQQIKRRERELMEFHRSRQRTVARELFPASQPGGRGATSPLGGLAVPAEQPRKKR